MDTRKQILEATVRIFAERGSRGATTRKIADEAGINEVTLFRQFGSKKKLLQEALEWTSQQVQVSELPNVPDDPFSELSHWCLEHIQALYGVRALLRASMGECEVNPAARTLSCRVPNRAAEMLINYLDKLQKQGMCAEDIDLSAASALLMGALFSDAISRDIMPDRFPYSLEEASDLYVRLFLRSIAPESGSKTTIT